MSTSQKPLFVDAPWEEDDAEQRLVASVVFAGPLHGSYDYLVPDRLRGEIQAGKRIRVPLGRGNRATEGYCVELQTGVSTERKLKEIISVIDQQALLSTNMLRLTAWIAKRYLCSWGQVLETVLPAGVRVQAGTRLAKFVSIPEAKLDTWQTEKLTTKQRRVMEVVAASAEGIPATEAAQLAQCTQAPLQALLSKGLLEEQKQRTELRTQTPPAVAAQENFQLNPKQQQALQAVLEPLHAGRHQTLLLHGVTGSGKTEVYIQAIQEVVSFGRQAIVLVPEISLTPQTVERFRARFPGVAVLHSHQSNVERHWHWQQIAAGKVSVVVGARSAVFAPTPNLGLIILDEEHESSFKQESAPRYHAREVALRRATEEQIPLILGSATPSLETWHRATQGIYRLIELPDRVFGRPLPDVATIDLRMEKRGKGALSRPLRSQMERVLQLGGQVILLLNRRGFSTHLQCPACGHVVHCPHCDIGMTYHRADDYLLCHYCDHQDRPPQRCPECDSPTIRYAGVGTQKLEAEIQATFRDYRCLRMDADTMQKPGAHERALQAFRDGDVRILLGTQMIAKGLDFPNVTLVGVINADLALHLPDFRAAERTFQLLAQVAGRAGRGEKGGRVLVQTFTPDHPAIQAAALHDYDRFVRQELPSRRAFGYPPFGSMIRLVLRGPEEKHVEHFARTVAEKLQAKVEEEQWKIRVLGPAPAPLAKLRDKFRYNLQLQGPSSEQLRELVEHVQAGLKTPDDLEWIADVDPVNML